MGRRRTRWLTYNSVLNMINKFVNIRICPCIISEPNRLSWLIDRLMFYAISAFYKSFNGGTFVNIKVYLHFGNWCIICIFKTYKRVCSTTWQLMILWIFSDIWIIKWKQLKITISLWTITNDLSVIHIIYICTNSLIHITSIFIIMVCTLYLLKLKVLLHVMLSFYYSYM